LKAGHLEQFFRPLNFLFSRELAYEDKQVLNKVETIRQKLACGQGKYHTVTEGIKNKIRTPSRLAYKSSVTTEWGMFLYLCAKSFQARTILELGSGAGISGCYLTSASSCRNFITIEGSSSLASLAARNISQITTQARVVHGFFDNVLESILSNLSDRVDLVYLDGPKDRLTTLRYFQQLIPYLNNGSIVIFDDIHWSKDMWKMWQTVRQWKGLAYTVNAGRFGVCLWKGGSVQPIKINLSLMTGWLRIGNGFDDE
jgi:predicted O-methyltransferase YrrM